MSKVLKSLKIFADLVKNSWGYFMTFLAVVTFIWTLGVKSERKTLDNATIKKDISELKENVKKLDTVIISLDKIKRTQVDLIESQNAIRNSYVRYLVNNPTLSKQDFIEYMQGLEFQIAPLQKSDTRAIPEKDTTYYVEPIITVKPFPKEILNEQK